MSNSDIKAIKQALQSQILSVVSVLAGKGLTKGIYYIPIDKASGDNKSGSLFITVKGQPSKLGNWQDKARGEYGDIFNLIAYFMNFSTTDQKDSIKWAVDYLGGKAAIPDYKPVKIEPAKQKQTDQNNAKSAANWFAKGLPLKGSLAEKYLHGRDIIFPENRDWPASLKFFKSEKHSFSKPVKYFPLLMAAWSNPQNKIVAVYRTFLSADGADKADVSENRLSWPSPKGCVIRLGVLREGIKQPDLKLVEGLEDGLSAMLLFPESLIWCFGSHVNIRSIKLPKVHRVTLFADNDFGNPQAQHSVQVGLEALQSQNNNVSIMYSPIGKDANDLLRASQKFN